MAGVDFGNTQLESRIVPETQVQNPVENKSGLYLAAAADNALQGVGTIFGGIIKSGIQTQANSVLNNYRLEVTRIADAVDQGGLSPQAARTRMRKLYTDTLANNPSLSADIDKLHSTLISENGIGNVIKTGNEQTQLNQKVAEAAYSNGWITPSGTPDVEGYQRYQIVTRQAQDTLRDIQVRTAQRGEVSAMDKERLNNSIHAMAEAGYPWVEAQVQQAAKLIDGGADPAETLTKLKADVGAQLNQFTTASGGEDISYIIKPMQDLLTTFEDAVTGKTSTDVLNAQIAAMKAKGEYILRSDPEIAKTLAVSELFGQNAQSVINRRLTNIAVRLFGENLKEYDPNSDSNSKPADVIGQDGNIKAYLDTVAESMNNAKAEPSPELTKEVGTTLTNVLRSLNSYNADSVKDYRNVIDFLASPAVEKWVGNGNLIIPKSVSDKAVQVIQDQYQNELEPVVSERWTGTTVTLTKPSTTQFGPMGGPATDNVQLPISEVIQPVWNGNSVTFQPKPEYANNPTVVGTARALNTGDNSISGPLNTLIHAKAHAAGSTDYTTEWNDLNTRLFGGGEGGDLSSTKTKPLGYAPTPTDSNPALGAIDTATNTIDPLSTTPENLTLKDFNDDMEAVYQTVKNSSAADPQAMVDASNPLEIAKAYLGLNENNPDQAKTIAAFIKNSAGIDINPAKTAWCAAFMDAIFHAAGSAGTGQLNARSYLNWGTPVTKPKPGDVVVFQRGNSGWEGHVGLYMGTNPDGTIKVLGGNQGDSVSEDDFDPSKVLGFRRAS